RFPSLPLRAEVRDEPLRLLGDPECAHEQEAPDAGLACGGDEISRSLAHHPLEVRGPAGDDRDQVNDDLATGDGTLEARPVRNVRSEELATPRLEGRSTGADANEATHGP